MARAKALEKQKQAKAAAPAVRRRPSEEDDEDLAADEDEEEGRSGATRPVLVRPADARRRRCRQLLADPLRATRKRYLPPGRYTVEITAGRQRRTARRSRVKPAKRQTRADDDEP